MAKKKSKRGKGQYALYPGRKAANKRKRQERHVKRQEKTKKRTARIKERDKDICDYWMQITGRRKNIREIKLILKEEKPASTLHDFYQDKVKENLNKELFAKKLVNISNLDRSGNEKTKQKTSSGKTVQASS